MLKAMDVRQHNEFATQAALHKNMKIPFKHLVDVVAEVEPEIQMDPDEEERILAQARSRVKKRVNRG